MITITLLIVTVGLIVLVGLAYSKNQYLKGEIETLTNDIEKLEKSNEMSNATRQLLRNEVTLLQSKLAKMEKPAVSDKPKNKRPAPKMKTNNKEQNGKQ